MKVIRSSRHFYHQNNKIKTQLISDFLDEYHVAMQKYINFIWQNPLPWQTSKGEDRLLDIQNLILDCPSVYDYQITTFQTNLSARALSSAITQSLSVVKSKTNDVRKRKYALQKATEEHKSDKIIKKLQEKLEKSIEKLQKPNIGYYNKAELSSKNVTVEISKTAKHFEYWLKFSSLGTNEPFVIPVVLHKQDLRLMGKQMKIKGSFLIGRDYCEIRYDKEVEKREKGETIGCDTGIKTVAYFSHQENETDRINGLTYEDTVERCARQKKGSKNFQQAMACRKNVINALINLVNFDNVKQINLEDNQNLKQGKRLKRYLQHHAYGEIKQKLEQVAEELGVQVKMQTSNYKSQRCSDCGWTQESNRDRKKFECKRCGFAADADYNASENNRSKLCWLDMSLISKQKLNITGFEWLAESGEEPGVPHSVGSDISWDME